MLQIVIVRMEALVRKEANAIVKLATAVPIVRPQCADHIVGMAVSAPSQGYACVQAILLDPSAKPVSFTIYFQLFFIVRIIYQIKMRSTLKKNNVKLTSINKEQKNPINFLFKDRFFFKFKI